MDNIKKLYLKCKNCNNNEFIYKKNKLICLECHLILTKNSKLIDCKEKNKNKNIHLNNVIKNIETIDIIEVNNYYKLLLSEIKNNIIDNDYINISYISDFLKKYNKRNYILSIILYNKFKNINCKISNQYKIYIKIIFNEYMEYLFKNDPQLLYSNSISYQNLLYLIIKYLKLKLYIKPSIIKNNNEKFRKNFENFLNNLCDNFFNNIESKNDNNLNNLYFFIENDNNNQIDYDIINNFFY